MCFMSSLAKNRRRIFARRRRVPLGTLPKGVCPHGGTAATGNPPLRRDLDRERVPPENRVWGGTALPLIKKRPAGE